MIHAVIMAGGKGERFWPLSREKTPKQLLAVTGAKTMLEETAARLSPRIPPERIWAVTTEAQAKAVRRLLKGVPPEQVIAEPVGRNTAPCLILAAEAVSRRDPRAVIVALPADHEISPKREFLRTILAAAKAAEKTSSLITIGIPPRGPATGYGYILRRTEPAYRNSREFYPVERFTEKPGPARARRFVKNPRYSWNSGMFVWQASVLLEAARRFLPETAAALEAYRTLPSRKLKAFLARVYPRLEAVSIDYGVMEKAPNVLVTPASFAWDDVGSWDALVDHLVPDAAGNRSRGPAALAGCSGCLTFSAGPLVGAVGIRDLTIVAADDAVLVCPRGKSQEVKELVNLLRREGRRRHL